MITLGITGGIGSGKTTVCKFLETLNIPVYYADDRAKWLMANDETCRTEIIRAFGEKSFEGGKLNRTYLAANVFSNPDQLEKLNSIVHPAVGRDFAAWSSQYADQPIVAKEAALLVETGSYKQLDKLVLVTATEQERIKRVVARDAHRTEEDVRKIIQKQLPEEDKRKVADFVIENGDRSSLIPQITNVLRSLGISIKS